MWIENPGEGTPQFADGCIGSDRKHDLRPAGNGKPEFTLSTGEAVDLPALADKIREGMARKKSHNIIIKAEGVSVPTEELVRYIRDNTGQEARMVVLAYLQRGGSPSCRDRMLASLMGNRAVELIQNDTGSRAVGITGNEIVDSCLEDAVKLRKEAALDLLAIIDILSK